ncbi:MAG: HAD family hydrolase [Thermoanaerobaculia bacterium]
MSEAPSAPGASASRRGADSFRVVVFDWDGTLLDSIATIVACARAALEELELPIPPEATLRSTIGLGLTETVEALIPRCDDETYQAMVEAYRRHWWGTYASRAPLIEGATAVLDHLARAGYLLAMATGKSRAGLEADLERTRTASLFAATRTVSEAASKPSPEMLLDLMRELGTRPAETLMVGDTAFDLQMASSAGCPAVGVTSGGHPADELLPFNPLAILDSVVSLPRWLAARYV